MFEFQYPYFFFLFIVLGVIFFWYNLIGIKNEAVMRFSDLELIPKKFILRARFKNRIIISIKILVISLFIIALARPRKINIIKDSKIEIVDIMLVIDMSSSMLAQDFKPNRLEAVKEVAKSFVKDREGDRLGIIIFAGESFIQCPLTVDTDVLIEFVNKINVAEEEYDGTAIGMAIANATNRLRFSDAKNKLMILLSDGSNNRGEIEPITAAELSEKFAIKIHTIGAGTIGKAPYPITDIWGRKTLQMMDVDVDEKTLKEIASVTGGRFFRATDNESLKKVYKEIDQLERTEIKVKEYKNYIELYGFFTLPGTLLIILLILLNQVFFRKLW
tara:strand:- start:1443 stop:2435 length:993 start_codon:yes stop_codon:yes gene_type:complete